MMVMMVTPCFASATRSSAVHTAGAIIPVLQRVERSFFSSHRYAAISSNSSKRPRANASINAMRALAGDS
jgi:hypothetical protein